MSTVRNIGKKSVVRAKGPIRSELIPVFVAWSDWEYFYSLLDGMLVHRRATPSSKFAGSHLYTWVKRGTVRIKCLAQEHNPVPRTRLEPGPLAQSGISALTIRTPHLPRSKYIKEHWNSDFSNTRFFEPPITRTRKVVSVGQSNTAFLHPPPPTSPPCDSSNQFCSLGGLRDRDSR